MGSNIVAIFRIWLGPAWASAGGIADGVQGTRGGLQNLGGGFKKVTKVSKKSYEEIKKK